jgi:hypothetical protein
VTEGLASAGPEAVRLGEALDPAVLVEDRRAEKVHRELERMWTSREFGIGMDIGCIDVANRRSCYKTELRTAIWPEPGIFDK